MTALHNRLSMIVAPATPHSLGETEGARGFLSMISRITLVRNMLIVGFVSLVAYVTLFCVFEQEHPAILQSKLLAAAALGASFHALFTAKKYVTENTFDSRYVSTYFVRLFLGIIAGPILANVFIEMGLVGSAENLVQLDTGSYTALKEIGPTTIALLGGYSADAVNRILNRLVQTLIALVQGDASDMINAKEQQAKARYAKKQLIDRREIAKMISDARKEVTDDKARETMEKVLDYLADEDPS